LLQQDILEGKRSNRGWLGGHPLILRFSRAIIIFPVNSTSQWRTLILVNSQNCESVRWLSQFYFKIDFQVTGENYTAN
jgi:hypothetical protein